MSPAHLFHPNFGTSAWVPRLLSSTPTLRVKDYVSFSVQAGSNRVGGFIGPLIRDLDGLGPVLNLGAIGSYGAAAAVPFTGAGGDLFIVPRQSPFFPTCHARLHRIGVSVSCMGPTGAGVLLPTTYLRIGMMRAKVDPRALATWTNTCDWLEAQSTMKTFSGYNLMTAPRRVATAPLDFLDWCELRDTTTAAAGGYNNYSGDQLCPICFVISAASSGDNYVFTVHLEWDLLVEGAANAGTLLAGSHIFHPSVEDGFIHRATVAMHDVAGHVEDLALGAGAAVTYLGRAGSTIMRGAGSAGIPRALPALMDAVPYVAI